MQCRLSVWTAVGATIYPDTRAHKFGSASASNLFSPCKARAIYLTSLSYMHVRETLPRYGTSTVNCHEHIIPWWVSHDQRILQPWLRARFG